MVRVFWSDREKIRLRIILNIALILIILALNLSIPWAFKEIINALSISDYPVDFTFVLAIYGLIWLLSNVLFRVREFVCYRVFERSISNFDLKIFKVLLNLPINFYSNHHTGGIMNAIEVSQRSISYILYGVFFAIIPMFLELVLAAGIISFSYGIFYACLLVAFPLVYIIYSCMTGKWLVGVQRQSSLTNKKFASYVNDTLLNIEGIQYQSAQKQSLEQFNSIVSKREDAMTKKLEVAAIIGMGQNLIAGIGLVLMTVITGLKVVDKQLNIGDFVLLNGYLLQFIIPLNILCFMFREVMDGLIKMENIFNIINTKRSVNDGEVDTFLDLKGCAVKFEDVSFAYPERKDTIIKNINFIIPKNKSIAIIGENGSGKSTITKLLFRMYEASSGKILVEGQNIKNIKLASLRDHIAVVPQSIFLLDDTVYANLILGTDVSADSVFFKDIMKSIGVNDLVKLLPNGYCTNIGERGVKLSGGQKQLIGIARALLKKPKILILDEATSALDNLMQQKIFSYLGAVKNITKLMITHNTSNLDIVDNVLYISQGQLKGQGDHKILMKFCNEYAEFCKENINV
jgi:ATP-binding cassette subfamily B protein